MEQKLDLNTWPRKEIYSFFRNISNPFYMVTFRQDVTALRRYTRQRGLSFYYALIFLCTQAIHTVEAFRITIRNGELWQLDGRIPSFTDLKPGIDCFHIVTLPLSGSLDDFCRAARARSLAQTAFLDESQETDALLYFSCLPWVDLTGLTNERDLSSPAARDDSVPRIAWGKYVPVGDRLELGISLEVNHRLIDGIHIGRFADALTRLIEALPEE
mgnify:CR=1 FL=1